MKRLIILILMLLTLISGVNAIAYDIKSSEYNSINLSVSGQESIPEGMSFNNDGSKVFIIGRGTDSFYEYTCTTNFQINTCSYASRTLSVSGQDVNPVGMDFNNDGSKVFMIGNSNGKIFEYTCTTNFQINTCSYASKSLTVSGEDSSRNGMSFNDDGSKVFMAGRTNDKIFEYTCSTNYDMSTCSYASKSLTVSGQGNDPSGITFNNDGSKAFVITESPSAIFDYDCSTNYDMSTCSYSNNNFSISSQDGSPSAIKFNDDGKKIFMIGSQFDKIYEYDIKDVVTITINSPLNNSFFNNLSVPLNISTDLNTNLTYSLNNGSNITLCNNCNSSTNITLTGILGTNEIIIYSNLTGVISSSTNIFTIDTINPSLSVSLPTEYNYYLGFNFSTYINFSDTNIDTCVVTISGETVTTCSQTNYNFTFNGNHTINITATDLAGNTNSSLNNIMLINPIQYFYFTRTNGATITDFTFGGTSWTNFANISTYNSLISLGSNNLTFSKLGFANTDIIFNVNTTSQINLTTNITDSKIILRIFDENTKQLLTGLTTITLIATTGFNSTTITGLLNISDINFINEQYQIIAQHTGYATETVFFDYDNQQLLSKDIYMINSSSATFGTITLQALNSNSQFIDGAICSANEWFPSLSSFISVSEGKTNINGETILNIDIGAEFYKFQCTKLEQTAMSNSQIIQNTGTILPIIFTTSSQVFTGQFNDFKFSLINSTENVTHQRFIYTYQSTSNILSKACLNSYNVKGTTKTLINQNCSTSSFGELQSVLNVNNSFNLLVEAVSINNNIDTVHDNKLFKSNIDLSVSLSKYHLDLVLPLLFVLIGLVFGYVMTPKNVFLSQIGVFIGVWISVLIVPSVISTSIASFITIIILFMIWGTTKK